MAGMQAGAPWRTGRTRGGRPYISKFGGCKRQDSLS